MSRKKARALDDAPSDEIMFAPGSEARLRLAIGEACECFIVANRGSPSAEVGAQIVAEAVNLGVTIAQSIGLSRADFLDIVEDMTAPEPEAFGHA
jgi:hypothetical protein